MRKQQVSGLMAGLQMTSASVRKQILTSDENTCIRCGGAANDVHHRKLKGMGGSKLLDTPENLISLCRYCHSWIHLHPTAARNAGYIVPTGRDPEIVPVNVHSGLFWLQIDGTRLFQGSCDEAYYF